MSSGMCLPRWLSDEGEVHVSRECGYSACVHMCAAADVNLIIAARPDYG